MPLSHRCLSQHNDADGYDYYANNDKSDSTHAYEDNDNDVYW